MKILNRKEFLALPEGTLYSKYRPCVFGPLEIKGATWGNDFLTQQIADAVECQGSIEYADILIEAEATGKSFSMDFYCEGRDGIFDEDQLFAVWEHTDVIALIRRLSLLLPSDEGAASG